VACTVPPFIVWAIGYHMFKTNPAVLMAPSPARAATPAVAARRPRKSTARCRGSVPVAYAVSGVLLTVLGYFAMILAH